MVSAPVPGPADQAGQRGSDQDSAEGMAWAVRRSGWGTPIVGLFWGDEGTS
jgi:hypothetical protein